MKRSGWRLLAAVSLCVAAATSAATRPQYGGSLRVATHIAPISLDPADSTQPDSIARRNIMRLIYDTLVTVDNAGRIQPALATSWQAEPSNQRWQFFFRKDVDFQDGSPLRADAIAASLRRSNPAWTVYPTGNSVVIECSTPQADLANQLALSQNSIAKRTPLNTIFGTGPFQIADWQPGKRLALTAQEGYWGGRPFVDSIVVEMGKSWRDQVTAFDLAKSDIVEVGPELVRAFAGQSRNFATSAPIDLVALTFRHAPQSPEEAKLREALAFSIDRAALRNVIFQGQGEIAAGLLPGWMSGYEFVFPANMDLQRARQMSSGIQQKSPWLLGYDGSDALARLLAERITLNARDAGITLQPAESATADLELARKTVASIDSRVALTAIASAIDLPQPAGNSAEDLFKAEAALLQTQRIIPLLHVPAIAYATSSNVKNFILDRDGQWHLSDVWLGTRP